MNYDTDGKGEVVKKRIEMVQLLDGDLFYPMDVWPSWVESTFWHKPMSDEETFKIFLFFVGNGCPPEVITEWVMTSQWWNFCEKARKKRAMQLNYLTNSLEKKNGIWFYFDLYHKKVLYLNGDVKA